MTGRIVQKEEGFGVEIASRLRWFWVYTFPKLLAGPFQSVVFRGGFFLVFALIAIAFALSVPRLWGDLFRALLTDLLIEYLGENSAQLLVQWLTGLPNGWILLALIGYGALAYFWAEPRRKFLHEVENTARLPILRGGGRRLDFLNRMNRALNSGMGLGPAARILPDYVPRAEDEQLREQAAEIRTNHTQKGFLISGPPTSGKTRTALELIADLNPALVIVWAKGSASETQPALPEWKAFTVFLGDDLAFASASGEGNTPAFLHYLMHRCPRGLLIATARGERVPSDIRDLRVFQLDSVERNSLEPLAEIVARAESTPDRPVTSEEVLNRYNGHPGSLVAGLEAMKDEYARLEQEARGLLQVARLSWEIGIRILRLHA